MKDVESLLTVDDVVNDPFWRESADLMLKIASVEGMKSKPLLGGPFAAGSFRLCSVAWTTTGLHQVEFMVIDGLSYLCIGRGSTKAEALADARSKISRPSSLRAFGMIFARIAAERAIERAELEQRTSDLRPSAEVARPLRLPVVPRRRRAIFDKSQGKCHYCGCQLDLKGKWHVEHLIPRALGGQSVEGNLVAACAPCNYKKSDRTDHEFIAQRVPAPPAGVSESVDVAPTNVERLRGRS